MQKPTPEEVHAHLFGDSWKRVVDRDQFRIGETGEIFTPYDLVEEIINHVSEIDPAMLTDSSRTVLDPACGDGQFLASVLYWKMEKGGMSLKEALQTIYGVELMPDNVLECQNRLLCGEEDLRHIVEQNIVCANSLKYHFRFDGTPEDPEEPEGGLLTIMADSSGSTA